jgi:hypothetical protein
MIDIRSPRFSFVQLATAAYGYVPETYTTCNFPDVSFCLPVYAYDDVAFQFIVTGTEAEMSELCSLGEPDKVEVGLVRSCGDDFDINFNAAYLRPDKARISATEVLYKWEHGFPAFDTEYALEECFYVKVVVHMDSGDVAACSNCFQRIPEDCFTSIIEYGAEQNIFGFNYCDSGAMFEEEEECDDPLVVEFTNATEIDIEYTAELIARFGQVPTVEIWIWDGSQYIKPFIQSGFDAYPPTRIQADLGGPATGFVKIS